LPVSVSTETATPSANWGSKDGQVGADPRDPARAVRVAALADVHGNAPALEAVLDEVGRAEPDLVVFCGDLTWGPLPEETLALLRPLAALFVRGNAERELLRLFDGVPDDASERQRFLAERHDAQARELVASFREHVVVDIDGLGPTRFCHGSPRSDEELVTPATPVERAREFLAGIEERAVVTAHTHVSYERVIDGTRLLNPGSVGLPYEGRPGAYWALLGPGVEHRRTEYDLDEAEARFRAGDNPFADLTVELLRTPPTRGEAIEHAESRVFSG
jgi:predicted phosphodiesterase